MTAMLRGAGGLGAIYCLTLVSVDPADLAVGVVLGAALTGLLARRLRPGPRSGRPPLLARIVWFPIFAGAVLVDVVQGTWDVALRVLHLRPFRHPGIVRVPIGERSARGVAVSALATTLSPGSVLVDVDRKRGDLLLHMIDASRPDEVRARLQRFYDRYQRRVFP